ncbi:hypothetical protein HYT24_02970 [Candidatus Pacearchaeota archaeon]|nr:hypothetical protein [Candidatus Pacearchaeota archaeon]
MRIKNLVLVAGMGIAVTGLSACAQNIVNDGVSSGQIRRSVGPTVPIIPRQGIVQADGYAYFKIVKGSNIFYVADDTRDKIPYVGDGEPVTSMQEILNVEFRDVTAGDGTYLGKYTEKRPAQITQIRTDLVPGTKRVTSWGAYVERRGAVN